MRTTFFQKLSLFSLGVFFALLLIEVVLRISGGVWLLWQERQNSSALKKSSPQTILCLGESTTALGGQDSYPSQLQKILNANTPNTFKVINQGVPSVNSEYILNHVEEWLERYHPTIVIIMMGINDENLGVEINRGYFLNHFKHWQTFKLGYFLWTSLHNKQNASSHSLTLHSEKNANAPERFVYAQDLQLFKEAQRLNADGKFTEGEIKLRELLNRERGAAFDYPIYLELKESFWKQKDYAKLVSVLKDILMIRPFDLNARNDIEHLCRAKTALAPAIKILAELNQTFPTAIHFYGLLSNCLAANGDALGAARKSAEGQTMMLKTINPKLQSNYLKLVSILQKRGIKTICAQYPLRNAAALKTMLLPAESFNALTFVDNEQVFVDGVSNEGYAVYFTDRFAGDFGHCTLKGNKLLAENIAGMVLK